MYFWFVYNLHLTVSGSCLSDLFAGCCYFTMSYKIAKTMCIATTANLGGTQRQTLDLCKVFGKTCRVFSCLPKYC